MYNKAYSELYERFRNKVNNLMMNNEAKKLIVFNKHDILKRAIEIEVRVIFTDIDGLEFLGPCSIKLKDLTEESIIKALKNEHCNSNVGLNVKGHLVILFTKMVRLSNEAIKRTILENFNRWFINMINGLPCQRRNLVSLQVVERTTYLSLIPDFVDKFTLSKMLHENPYVCKYGDKKKIKSSLF